MARTIRIQYIGSSHYVQTRGNDQNRIFMDDSDYAFYLDCLEEAGVRYKLITYGYCLLPSQLQLFVETPQGNLSRAMHWLNTRYASRLNRKYGRSGHLLHGRYASYLVDKDEYGPRVLRGLHLAPVWSGLVKRPEEYPWSSHTWYLDAQKPAPAGLTREPVLRWFEKETGSSLSHYRQYIEDGIKEGAVELSEEAIGGLVLGTPEFAAWVGENVIQTESPRHQSRLRKLKRYPTPKAIMEEVSKYCETTVDEMTRKWQRGQDARDLAIYLCRRHSDARLEDLGETFGGLTGAAISQVHRKIDERRKAEAKLDTLLARIETSIEDLDGDSASVGEYFNRENGGEITTNGGN